VSSEKPRITVVNDSPEFLELMADLLHDERYPVTLIDGDRENAVELIEAALPQALIIDLRLGSEQLHGWEVLTAVRRHPDLSELPILICTGDLAGLEGLADDLAGMRRVATITKPFSADELFSSLDALLQTKTA
jgi:CheY-like chemotaxis protein